MRRIYLNALSPLALLLAASAPLAAQSSTGALSGRVTLPKGTPLAGATVILESPTLFRALRLNTNEKGEWHAPICPVGTYEVKVSKAGHIGQQTRDLRVGLGTTQRLDFVLKPVQEASAVVEVVSVAAGQDLAESKVSVNYSGERLRQLPTATTGGAFTSAQSLTPGYVAQANGIRGGDISGTAYQLDGIDVKDSFSNRPLVNPLWDSVEDVQVVQSAVNARDGRVSGGIVKVLTKKGGNDFEGTLRTYYSRNSWRGDWSHTAGQDLVGLAKDDIARSWAVTVSGPVVKDRVWFYLGTSLVPTSITSQVLQRPMTADTTFPVMLLKNPGFLPYAFNNTLANANAVLRTGPGNGYAPTLGEAGSTIFGERSSQKYEGKLTAGLTGDHVLTLTFSTATADNFGTSDTKMGQARQSAAWYGKTSTTQEGTSLQWVGSLGSSTVIEASYSRGLYEAKPFAGPQAKPVSVWSALSNGKDVGPRSFGPFPITRYVTGNDPERHVTDGLKVNVSHFAELLGSHALDAGLETARIAMNAGRPSGSAADYVMTGGFYRNGNDVLYPTVRFVAANLNGQGQITALPSVAMARFQFGPAPVYMRSYAPSGESVNRTQALYLNDAWTLNGVWAVNLGLRYNRFKAGDTDGATLTQSAFLEPRLQVKWNPDGAGRNTARLTWARYAQEFSSFLTRDMTTDPLTVFTLAGWKGLPGQPLPGDPGDPMAGMYGVRFVDYDALVNPAHYGTPFQYQDMRQLRAFDGLKAPYSQETALTLQHASGGTTLALSLVDRQQRRGIITVSDYGFDNFVLVQDPSGQGGAPKWQQRRIFTNRKKATSYRSAELNWTQQVTANFSWGGSYSWYKAEGVPEWAETDYPSLFRDPAQPIPAAMRMPEGVIFKGQNASAYWTYRQPAGKGGFVSFTTMLTYIEGGRTSVTGDTPFDNLPPMIDPTGHGYDVQQVDPPMWSTYYGGFNDYKGMNGDSYRVNVKVAWDFPLLRKLHLIGSVEVTDALNRARRTMDPFMGWGMYPSPGYVPGRAMLDFPYVPGTYPNAGMRYERFDYDTPRYVSEFTVGIRF